MQTEEERRAILIKLSLLAEIMKLHEWTVFGQKEASEMERTEAARVASGSVPK